MRISRRSFLVGVSAGSVISAQSAFASEETEA